MVRMRLWLATVAVATAVLTGFAGCSEGDPATQASTEPSPVTTGPAAPDNAQGAATIAVEPAGAGCSPEGIYVGTVTWRVADETNVVITVGSGTVFAEGQGTFGTHRTGRWVVPGMKFTLSDASGPVLATTEAGPGDCEATTPGG